MNLEAEKIRLIDISSEDDLLIDSQLDSSSFDLRLSVACETQKELVCNLGHSNMRACAGASDAVPLSSSKEQETFHLERENVDNECSLRKSMAWDSAFFTSPGFLELEELCLVNRGFRNTEAGLSGGTEESVRSKICLERNANHKQTIQAGSRQKTPSLIRPKLVSPSKVTSMQDSKPQHISRRSSAIPRVVSKPHVIQSGADRRESLKSTRTAGLTRVPTTHMKNSPLKKVDKSGEIPTGGRELKSRRPDSRSVSSVSSSQYALSSVASSNSIDLSPYRNCSGDSDQNTNMWMSPVMQGGCHPKFVAPTPCDNLQTADIGASPQNSSQQILNYDVKEFQVDRQRSHLSPSEQTSLRKGQSAPNAARRSPLFADTQQASKPSCLRVPSQKIGFFDMKSEELEPVGSRPEARPSDLSKSLHSKDQDEPTNKLKYRKSKEGLQASLNQKAHRGSKGRMCNENLEAATKDQRRRNHHEHCPEKQAAFPSTEEKENIFHPDDTVIEFGIKHSSPSPSKPGAKTDAQCSFSSGKHLLKTRRPTPQMKPSLASARVPFSTKGSPLKRSAFF